MIVDNSKKYPTGMVGFTMGIHLSIYLYPVVISNDYVFPSLIACLKYLCSLPVYPEANKVSDLF